MKKPIHKKTDKKFEPRQSTRLSTRIEADNDKWTEYLTVIDLLNPRTNVYELQVRSFFESEATKKKVWDEPPSGAKNVVWATDNMKEMAHKQMKDLRVIDTNAAGYGSAYPNDWEDGNQNLAGTHAGSNPKNQAMDESNGNKKKGFWKKFVGAGTQIKQLGLSPRRFSYQKGSKTEEFHFGTAINTKKSKKSRKSAKKEQIRKNNDINLQLGLAQSLGFDGEGGRNGDDGNSGVTNGKEQNTEETLAVAKAMSLSLYESEQYKLNTHGQTHARNISLVDTHMGDASVDASIINEDSDAERQFVDRKLTPEELHNKRRHTRTKHN